MMVRTNCARVCVALLIAFISSTTHAQVSGVSDRASLAGTDFIDWQAYHDGVGDYTILNDGPITTNGGAGLTVMQPSLGYGVLIPEPNAFYPNTNLPDGEFLYHTNNGDILVNPISFSGFTGMDVCGLGTQVSPVEEGAFNARIEAFDANGSLGFFDFTGGTSNPDALFIGIESTGPMTSVEVSVLDTRGGLGAQPSFYAINGVDLRACVGAPAFSCEGFGAPMAVHPVKGRKNGVFPLKMQLFDADGFEITAADLAAAPVVEVLFTSVSGGDPVDVSSEVLGAGRATDGNQFVYTENGIWQFNLKTKGYTAEGTYMVTAVSGDEEDYVLDPACVTSFVK